MNDQCPFLRQFGWFLIHLDLKMKDLEGLGYKDRVSGTNYSLKIVVIVSGWLIPKRGILF